MKQYISTNGAVINIKVWNGQRVLSFTDIQKLHGFSHATPNYRYTSAKSFFKEGKDMFTLTNKNETSKIGSRACKIILFTKSGYELLMTEREKKESKKIIDEYFDCKSEEINVSHETKAVKGEANENVEEKKLEEEKLEKIKPEVDVLNVVMEMTQAFIATQNEIIKLASKQTELINELLYEKRRRYSNRREQDIVVNENQEEVSDFIGYNEWKREILNAAGNVVSLRSSKYKSIDDVLSCSYSILKNKYGTCWEQYKKEFYSKYDKRSKTTLGLEYWIEKENPSCRNLLLSVIKNIYDEEKKATA